MKDLVWDSSLSVHVKEVDDDHRRLVDLFNSLGHAVAQGEAKGYIEALLEELISLTAWHFRHEERLMLRHGYEGLDEHRVEHEQLIESARALQQRFVQGSEPLSIEDIEFLEHWLTEHIYVADMRMGSYLGEVM